MQIDTEYTGSLLRNAYTGFKRRFNAKSVSQRLNPKPKPIATFPGEDEIYRKKTVLVTDTRLAYIDPYDRTLKTFMFEHMISLNKRYYRSTPLIHLFCKVLLLINVLLLLVTIIVDLLDDSSSGFLLVYIPLLLSLMVGLLVWRDMRPKYRMEWKMRDGSNGHISTEPMFREWVLNRKGREQFMDELALAMNQALAAKSWWPSTQNSASNPDSRDELTEPSTEEDRSGRSALRLVTDHYQ